MLNLFRYIGIRHLAAKPGRTFLTILGVALGIGLSVAINLINAATLRSFSDTIMNLSGQADISVTAGDLGFPEAKLELIENTSGVKSAVPVIEEHAYLLRDKKVESLYVVGVDLLRESAVRTYKTNDHQIMDDPQIFLNQPDSLIVSTHLAESYGLKIDSKIELVTARGPRPFTVRGILAPEGTAKAFGGAVAVMDIDGARVTFGKENKMDRVDVVLREAKDLDVVTEALKKTLGPGYKVEKPEDRAQSLAQLVSSFQKNLRLIASMAVVIGLLLVANSLKVAVSERRREIGILRSLGTTRAAIRFMFLSDAVVIGLIGASLGALVGWFMATQLVAVVSHGMSNEFMMTFETPTIRFAPFDFFRALIVGVVASSLASLWPSTLAARVQPVEAMAVRANMMSDSGIRRVLWIMAAIGVFIIAILSISSSQGWNLRSSFVQNLHQIAGPPSIILLTPLLTYVFSTLLAFFARLIRFGIASRIAFENLTKDPGKAAGNILTLSLGLYLVVTISTINTSFKGSIGAWADRALSADLAISSFGRIGGLQTQPLHEDLKSELMALKEVQQNMAHPVSAMRFIHADYQGKTIGIKAWEEPEIKPNGQIADDGNRFDVVNADREEVTRLVFKRDAMNIAVSKNFAQKFSVQPGQDLTLNTPSGPQSFHVVGLVNDFASSQGVWYMARPLFKKLWNDHLVNLFYLQLKDPRQAEPVKLAIDRELGMKNRLQVKFSRELKSEIMTQIDQSFTYTRAIELAALLSGLIGMMNMMFISILERTREIGLLRAVGMSRGQVFGMVSVEAITQGLIAALISVSLGLLLAYIWIRFSLSQVLGWTVDFHLSSQTILTSVILGMVVSGLAGLIPAWRATGLEIKESLANE